jgi:hypothetical protein
MTIISLHKKCVVGKTNQLNIKAITKLQHIQTAKEQRHVKHATSGASRQRVITRTSCNFRNIKYMTGNKITEWGYKGH